MSDGTSQGGWGLSNWLWETKRREYRGAGQINNCRQLAPVFIHLEVQAAGLG